MSRITGNYQITRVGGEEVRPLHPTAASTGGTGPDDGRPSNQRLAAAMTSLGQLSVAANMVPSPEWFLYGFVRKEALITSQIEGTQATLRDVLAFEAGEAAERPEDVQEVCNYVDALTYARREMARPKGLPLCTRLLCEAHRRLMQGVRGNEKEPGEIRRSQNWIGGTRPGNARFIPPPPTEVAGAMSALEKWIHATDPLPPLVRAGLAHVQFETIHPFLDGNGRIGRLLIALLVEHWGLLKSPLLYLSVAFKRHQEEYYRRLSAVRTDGDWEGWTGYFLDCVREAAEDGVHSAQLLFGLIARDRIRLANHRAATVPAIRLFDHLPRHPMVTLRLAIKLLKVSKPTAIKALDALQQASILQETTGKLRDRVYAYHAYLDVLTTDTQWRLSAL